MASRVDDSSDVAMPPKDLAELEVDSTASENLSVLCVKRGIANSQGLSSTVVKVAPDAPSTVQVDLPGVEGSNDARAHALDLENKALAAELTQSFAREARLRAHATALTERLHEASSVQVHPESVEFKEVNLLRQHVRRLQDMVDEVERGRQQAVFKISELATKVAANGEDHVEVEWIQKAKHDFELLNQRTRLLLAQQEERHAAALDVAMRRLALEHAAAIDKLRLDHDIQLTEWRHEESRRMKEVEAAMEADKSSVRLEMKHSIESTRIHQRVVVPAATAPSTPREDVVDADTIVRLKLDALRTRRMDALKKMGLIRISMTRTRLHVAWMRWSVHGGVVHARKRISCHSIATLLAQRRHQAARRRFQGWYLYTKLHHWQSIHSSVLSRIVAVERLRHVMHLRARTKVMRAFARWRGGNHVVGDGSREAAQLRQEITMLHDELAKTKAETWRCKRQMLQQFKQSAM